MQAMVLCPKENLDELVLHGGSPQPLPRVPCSMDVHKNLHKTIALISRRPWNFTRAAAYIQSLVDCVEPPAPKTWPL